MAQITMKSVCAIFSLKNQKGYNMYTFDSRIRYSEIDRSGRLSIPAVVDYFQDCSAFQSEELGVGVEYLANKKRAWILNSWQIVFERRPEECENIIVGTWGSGFDKFHATRNFIMETTKGERLAYANSIWVYINTETGMPIRPGQEEINVYKLETPLEMEYEPRKIKLSREWEDKEAVKVQRSWIDSNEHVNNSWYYFFLCRYCSTVRLFLETVLGNYIGAFDFQKQDSGNDREEKLRRFPEFYF